MCIRDRRTTYCFKDRADPPIQKENSNFCDYFRPSSTAFNSGRAIKSSDSIAKLESLFGQGEEEDTISSDNDAVKSKEDETKKALNDLFN